MRYFFFSAIYFTKIRIHYANFALSNVKRYPTLKDLKEKVRADEGYNEGGVGDISIMSICEVTKEELTTLFSEK